MRSKLQRGAGRRLSAHAVIGVACLVVLGLACKDSTGTVGAPSGVVVVRGNNQIGTVGTELPDPLVVRIEDDTGAVMVDALVIFATATDGRFDPDSAFTDSAGIAQTRYILGTGARLETITATVERRGAPGTFTLTAKADLPALLAEASGDDQIGRVGRPLAAPMVVVVTDQFGNPVPDVNVAWTVEGDGTLSEMVSLTGANGRGATTLTFGATLGTVTVTAHAIGGSVTIPDVSFSATSRP